MVRVYLTESGHKKVFGVGVDELEPLIVDERDVNTLDSGVTLLTLRRNGSAEKFILEPHNIRSIQSMPVAVTS